MELSQHNHGFTVSMSSRNFVENFSYSPCIITIFFKVLHKTCCKNWEIFDIKNISSMSDVFLQAFIDNKASCLNVEKVGTGSKILF